MSEPTPSYPPPPFPPGAQPPVALAESAVVGTDGVVFYRGEPVTVTAAAASGRSLRRPRWGLWDCLLAIVGSFIPVFLIVIAFVVTKPQGEEFSAPPPLVVVLLVAPWLVMAGWPVLAARLRGNGAVVDFGITWRGSDLGWGVVGGLVGLMLAGIIGAITSAIAGDFGSNAGDVADELKGQGVWFYLFLLAVGVGAPIVEELAFRGILWSSLAKKGFRPWMATVASAVCFSAFHFEPIRFPLLLATGLVLGYLRQRTGSITAGIVAHMVNNSFAVLALLFLT